jgi:hypothetical protein
VLGTWDRPLKEIFPRLYTVAQNKYAAVADCVSWSAGYVQ